jgi:transcriptional regulator with XRE-family HTH domain
MINTNSPSRQARLKAWLLLQNIEQKALAEQLGISEQLLSMTLTGKRVCRHRIAALAQLGIPEELLPQPPERQKPGRKAPFLIHA